MEQYYLAIDIGASSGRHMLAWMEGQKLRLLEVYRFANGMKRSDGHLCWDTEVLFQDILTGLKRCREIGRVPSYMGIDTWGVDYVLMDAQDRVIGRTYGYRDSRTNSMDDKVYEIISPKELYSRTGIQKQIFNTIYQLMALKEQEPEHMQAAKSMLMMPDYFHFLLTGIKKMEYTNATTSQLVNAKTAGWDIELIERLGYHREWFSGLAMPGTSVGNFTDEVQKRVGFDCQVILPATHDTASAVLAVPAKEDHAIYISSGTWSLVGVERQEADCSGASMKANFTNEGGYQHRYRYLKNIMGLWMIQAMKKELQEELSFAQLCALASQETIGSIVDCNHQSFLAPASMIEAVRQYCRDLKQQVPETAGELAAVIYNSLAKCYGDTITEIEELTKRKYETIYIVGGGANAKYLNQLTAKYTGKRISAGPTEATSIGNIIVQMLYAQEFADLAQARSAVARSFEIKTYKDGAVNVS